MPRPSGMAVGVGLLAHLLFTSVALGVLYLHMYIGESLAGEERTNTDPSATLTWYYAVGGLLWLPVVAFVGWLCELLPHRFTGSPALNEQQEEKLRGVLGAYPLGCLLIWYCVGLSARFTNGVWADYREYHLAMRSYESGTHTRTLKCRNMPPGTGLVLPADVTYYTFADQGWGIDLHSSFADIARVDGEVYIAAPIVYEGGAYNPSSDAFGCRVKLADHPRVYATCRLREDVYPPTLAMHEQEEVARANCGWDTLGGKHISLRKIAFVHEYEPDTLPELWRATATRDRYFEYNSVSREAVGAYMDDFHNARREWYRGVLQLWCALCVCYWVVVLVYYFVKVREMDVSKAGSPESEYAEEPASWAWSPNRATMAPELKPTVSASKLREVEQSDSPRTIDSTPAGSPSRRLPAAIHSEPTSPDAAGAGASHGAAGGSVTKDDANAATCDARDAERVASFEPEGSSAMVTAVTSPTPHGSVITVEPDRDQAAITSGVSAEHVVTEDGDHDEGFAAVREALVRGGPTPPQTPPHDVPLPVIRVETETEMEGEAGGGAGNRWAEGSPRGLTTRARSPSPALPARDPSEELRARCASMACEG